MSGMAFASVFLSSHALAVTTMSDSVELVFSPIAALASLYGKRDASSRASYDH
jgi:hypothetical protein